MRFRVNKHYPYRYHFAWFPTYVVKEETLEDDQEIYFLWLESYKTRAGKKGRFLNTQSND